MSNDRNKWTYIDIKLAGITFLYIAISKQNCHQKSVLKIIT